MIGYPSHIVEEAGQRTDRALREIIDRLNENEPQITDLNKRLGALRIPTIAEIQKDLQLGGTNTINITGVLGVAGQAQPSATIGTHAVRVTTPPVLGMWFIESDRLVAYVGEQSGSAVVWVYVAGMMVATFTNRPADLGLTDAGFWFGASDQGNIAWRWNGTGFIYQYGIYERTQAQLAALAALLGANDAGYLVRVSTYLHVLKWSGSVWDFQDGDGSGYVAMGKPTGAAPNGGLWGLCDGTAYNCLNADGTLTNLTTQNLTGEVFLKGSTATAAQQAATVPTWQAGQTTDAAATGITVAVDAHTTSTELIAGASTVLTGPGTHTANVTDPNHQHGLSDANAKLNAPSEANGGLPLRISTVWYIRR